MQYEKKLDININNHLYNYALDNINTICYKSKQISPKKTHKHIFITKFDHRALEVIRLSKVFNHSDIIKRLPYNLRQKESIHTITY